MIFIVFFANNPWEIPLVCNNEIRNSWNRWLFQPNNVVGDFHNNSRLKSKSLTSACQYAEKYCPLEKVAQNMFLLSLSARKLSPDVSTFPAELLNHCEGFKNNLSFLHSLISAVRFEIRTLDLPTCVTLTDVVHEIIKQG